MTGLFPGARRRPARYRGRMRAVVFAGDGKVRIDDVPAPQVREPNDAVVEVSLSAICGSDLHLLHGKTPGMRIGGVIGHEFVGTVTDAGGDVSAFEPGDKVLGSFLIACGRCAACRRDRFNHCEDRRALGLGSLTGDLDGAQAESVRIPEADVNLLKLDDSAPDEAALFGGDVLATAYYSVEMMEIAEGETVAVFGGGPVGLLTAAAARARGGRPIVLDQDPSRVAFARERLELDAGDVSQFEPTSVVSEFTLGRMADVAIDVVGAVAAFKTALRCIAPGGRVGIVGVYGAERAEVSMGQLWIRGVDLRFAGMANVQAHWRAALDDVRSGKIDPTSVITHRLRLEDAVEGYELFESREAMKVTLRP
jgi:2-desacetyl-2-hydroxyethyl bacteriochlorophyllide A dehydrogenase